MEEKLLFPLTTTCLYLLKYSPTVNKRCGPVQSVKKLWNQRGWSRNGCDGIGWWQVTTIRVNFVLIPSEAGMRQYKLTWIVGIEIFSINLYHHINLNLLKNSPIVWKVHAPLFKKVKKVAKKCSLNLDSSEINIYQFLEFIPNLKEQV